MKKFVGGKLYSGLFCIAVMIVLCFSQDATVQARQNTTIHEGVYIGNTDVSGMTQEEAAKAVEEVVNASTKANITLQCVGDHTVVVTPEELGMVWINTSVARDAVKIGEAGNVVARYKAIKDLKHENKVLPIDLEFDQNLIQTLVEEKCDGYNQEAQDVSLIRTDGAFQTTEGKSGIILDNEAAKKEIYEFLTTQWDGQDAELTLTTIVDEPKGSVEELAAVKDVIGTFTTTYKTSGSERSANIANGCRLVNATTLYPGDTFSMYDTIKPFSVENGYHMAGSYVNGLVVDSLGGGICQVSTTLYNAVLRAELEVTERNNHSMIVAYVPASADAAIAESSGKDFKFTNNTEYPIYIEGITTPGKQITFNIYGVETRPVGRVVSFESEILQTTNPTTENIIQTTSQPVGFAKVQSAHIGYKARLWKIVTEDGVETDREVVNNSTYKMVPRTVTVGVATNNPEAYNQIQAAIATGSIDQVKAVSDAWAAASAAEAAAAAQQQAAQQAATPAPATP